jgi:type II secretion system protein G
MPRYSQSGFTLLELLVVIVIIGLLAGYVAPRYFAQEGKSKTQVTRAQIDSFEKALDQYRLDTGHYPTSEQGLAALVTRPNNEPKWSGPYLRKRCRTIRGIGRTCTSSQESTARWTSSRWARTGNPAGPVKMPT